MGKSAAADRGKETENEVIKFLLEHAAAHVWFDWQRMPDARAARGAIKAQIADFEWFSPGRHGTIEAKETEHEYRLTREHISQLPKLRVRSLAGGENLVLVYHSTTKEWRIPDFKFLANTDGASWDLREFPTYYTCAEALLHAGLPT